MNYKLGDIKPFLSDLLAEEKNWNIAKSKDVNFKNKIFKNSKIISTGNKEIDKILNGGFKKGQYIAISGGTNSGKSSTCISFGVNAIKSNYKVVHISLERIQT